MNKIILKINTKKKQYLQKEIDKLILLKNKRYINLYINNMYIHIYPLYDQEKIIYFLNKINNDNILSIEVDCNISNLSCSGCINKIYNMFKTLNGINHVNVNIIKKRCKIIYNPTIIKFNNIVKNIRSIGFDINFMNNYRLKKFKTYKKKTIYSLILVLLMIIINYYKEIIYFHKYFQLIISSIMIYISLNFIKYFFIDIRKKILNMNSLISIGVLTNYIYSILNIFITKTNEIYFESTTIIILFILIGETIKEYVFINASYSINKLTKLYPNHITVLENNKIVLKTTESIKLDDIIILKPGDTIVFDGVITRGNSYINESNITGEYIPKIKKKGDKVISGSVNYNSTIYYRVTNLKEDSFLHKLITSLKQYELNNISNNILIDKICKYFIHVIIFISICTFMYWYFYTNNLNLSIKFMLNVLLISCPCSIGLAIPIASIISINKCADIGIIIKDIDCLINMCKIDTIVFDKTGTLTTGKIKIEKQIWKSNVLTYKKILKFMVKNSSHPICISLLNEIDKSCDEINNNISIIEIIGKGIICEYNNDKYYLGNWRWVATSCNLDFKKIQKYTFNNIYILFARLNTLICEFILTDTIKLDSYELINFLKKKNINCFIASGDNKKNTNFIAKKLNIQNIFHDLLYKDKEKIINNLKLKNKYVCMIGDGINDFKALYNSDISICMSNEYNISMNASNISIIDGDLRKIQKLFKISKITRQIIKQNILWAFIYNILVLPIAFGALYTQYNISINPSICSILMCISSTTVLLNTLRIKFLFKKYG